MPATEEEVLVMQGRRLQAQDLEEVRQLIAAHPDWSRRRISQQLCVQWNWRNQAGQCKDMAARTLLVKLQQRGLLTLPLRRQTPGNRMRRGRIVPRQWDQTPIEGGLAEREGLRVEEVSQQRSGREELAAALEQFHYLGSSGGTVGENLQYRVSEGDRLLAGLWFGSAAWKCADRDRYLGWSPEEREANLWRISNNCRFVILPWVRILHLGSWILGQVLRQLSGDWQSKYGHGITLAETFVERDRFRGTVYRAANWQRIGQTQGRSRQDRSRSIEVPIKDIYVYPLQTNFREVLCHGTA
jgi:Druantia protein DruA